MKKHNSKIKILFTTLLAFLSVLIFASCDGIIFYEIRNEVELADSVVSGDINNIVRYKYNNEECIFASPGEIYYRSVEGDKANTRAKLSTFPTPSGFIYALAADSAYLYAASVVYEEDDDGYNVPKTRKLYCFDGSSWTTIWSESYAKKAAVLFCTNTPKNDHRHAYFRSDSTVWELNGKTDVKESITPFDTKDATDHSTKPTTGVQSCTVLKDTVYFSSSYAMTSNETKDENSDCIYRASGSTIYGLKKDSTDWLSANLGCDTIYAIGVTSDYILVGTKSGIAHQTWASTKDKIVPNSGTSDFSTNAASTLSSYYEVPAILVVNPAEVEKAATVFASSITSSSSASLKNVGLWSYCPSGDHSGEWNRE